MLGDPNAVPLPRAQENSPDWLLSIQEHSANTWGAVHTHSLAETCSGMSACCQAYVHVCRGQVACGTEQHDNLVVRQRLACCPSLFQLPKSSAPQNAIQYHPTQQCNSACTAAITCHAKGTAFNAGNYVRFGMHTSQARDNIVMHGVHNRGGRDAQPAGCCNQGLCVGITPTRGAVPHVHRVQPMDHSDEEKKQASYTRP